MQHPRFLIARFSSIGDIVLTAPVVKALREEFGPEARIDFITLDRMKSAVDLIPGLDQTHTITRSTAEALTTLRDLNFDYLIDLHSNVRSRSLARSLNILTLKVKKLGAARLSLVSGLRRKPVRHVVDRSLDVLNPFGITHPTSWPILNSESPDIAPTIPKEYITLAPGAAHEGKRLPASTLSAILTEFPSQQFVIVGGPDSLDLASDLSTAHPNVLNLCGQLSLLETTDVLKHSSLAIGGDTGAMHIAAAVQTPLISVWGCTRPSLGLAPWNPHSSSIILTPEGRGDHRPCSRHGAKCRYTSRGKDLCINHISPARISSAIRSILGLV